uniref:Prolyl endopeptidase n=1 Tax=Paramoeba aestuarina TaxID=180227 RepID=A0A7S4V0K9_9EUKA
MSSGGWRPPQGYPAARRDEEAGFVYPSPSKGDVRISEPYLWLEDPKGEETQEWVKKQVSLTSKFLEEKCDTRDAFRDTLKGLLNYPRVGVYSRHGDRYYFYRNSGLQNQSVLYRYNKPETYLGDHIEENTETILDANKMSEDGTVSVKHTVFSECGNYMAYSVAKSGSDWCEINVMDVKNEPTSLKDNLEWVRYSGLTWNNAGNSLLYSRYPAPKLSSGDGGDMTPGEEVDQSQNQRLYYHRLGTDQSEDVLIAEDPKNPHYMFSCAVSNDGERLLVHTSRDCNPEHLLSVSTNFKDFEAGKVDSVQLTPVVDDWIGSFSYLHSFGDFFLFMSNCKAEKYRILGIDVNDPAPEKWVEVIPEHSEDVLNSALYVKGALVCVYMHNAMERIEVFPLNEEWVNKKGKLEDSWDVELPGPGGISGLEGSHKHSEFFFSFLSFTDPGSIWRASAEDRSSTRVFATQLGKDAPDLDACGTRQIWYESADQTKVPMFVIGTKDNLEKCFDLPANDTKLPVQLYGYGGFNISLTPGFSVSRLIWITHLGGLVVVPNLRGGGEFGKGWHEAGQKEKKTKCF